MLKGKKRFMVICAWSCSLACALLTPISAYASNEMDQSMGSWYQQTKDPSVYDCPNTDLVKEDRYDCPDTDLIKEDSAYQDTFYRSYAMSADLLHKNQEAYAQLLTTTNIPAAPAGTMAKGVDISRYNGDIDFAALKDDIDFVIIRCGYGMDEIEQDDPYFKSYVQACIEYDIPYGVYLFSYATDESKARSEAAHTLRMLSYCEELGSRPNLPVFLDMEDSRKDGQISVSASMKATIAKTYCQILEEAGYHTGIYANTNWWTNYLTNSYFNTVTKWVAQFSKTCTYNKPYAMWQCTESAKISGQKCLFDYNYMLTNLYIDPIDIKGALITEINDQNYSGKQIKPSVEVFFGEEPLILNKDYIVRYGSNKNPGKGSLTIEGKLRYKGSIRKEFVILPGKAKIAKATPMKKAVKVTWKKINGAKGYELALKKTGEADFKKYSTTKLNKTVKKLTSKKKYSIKVRAYILVDGQKHFGPYSPVKTVKAK